jgi:hypothetical protein
MPVASLDTRITLWCFDVWNNSKFKVIIGDGNDIDDLKEAIKERKQNDFAGTDADRLKLWRVNTDKTISEEILDDELEDTAKTIRETFRGVWGDNIWAVVRAPDTGKWVTTNLINVILEIGKLPQEHPKNSAVTW